MSGARDEPHSVSGVAPDRWPLHVALIAAAALLLRLTYLSELADAPILATLIGDGQVYQAWASRIAAGDWLGSTVFYQTPLYPYLMGVVYAVFGPDPGSIRLMQAGFGAMSCALLAVAGRHYFDRATGLLAAGLFAIYPAAIFFDGLIQKASLDALLMAAMLAVLGAALTRARAWHLWAAGLIVGLMLLNRENARVLVPIVLLWIVLTFADRPLRSRLSWAAGFLLAVAFAVLPVAARNYVVGGEFLISTSQLGSNFYIGNRAGASGTYDPLVAGRGEARYEQEDARRLAEAAERRVLTPAQASLFWLDRAWEDIRHAPGDWLRLMARKALLTVNYREAPDTEALDTYADYATVLRILRWLNFGVLLPLAVYGAWRACRIRRPLWLLPASAMALLASVALFFVFARYRFLAVPIGVLLAAAGVLDVARHGRRLDRSTVAAGCAALVCAVLAFWPVPMSEDVTRYNVGSELVRQQRYAEAIPLLEQATARTPGFASAQYNLGLAYKETGRTNAAIGRLRTALGAEPRMADAHDALSGALSREGRLDEALQHATEAVRLRPSSSAMRSNLGLLLWMTGRPAAAISHLQGAVALDPADAVARNNLGSAMLQAGQARDSIPQFETAITVRPEYAEAQANLAMALTSVGDARDALPHFETAVRIQPDTFGIRVNYARALAGLGRVSEAIAQYEHALSGSADSPDTAIDVHQELASLYVDADRAVDAVALLEAAIDLARSNALEARLESLTRAISSAQRHIRGAAR